MKDRRDRVNAVNASNTLLQKLADSEAKLTILNYVSEKVNNDRNVNLADIFDALTLTQTYLAETGKIMMKRGDSQDKMQYLAYFRTTQYVMSLGEDLKGTKLFSNSELESALHEISLSLKKYDNDVRERNSSNLNYDRSKLFEVETKEASLKFLQ